MRSTGAYCYPVLLRFWSCRAERALMERDLIPITQLPQNDSRKMHLTRYHSDPQAIPEK